MINITDTVKTTTIVFGGALLDTQRSRHTEIRVWGIRIWKRTYNLNIKPDCIQPTIKTAGFKPLNGDEKIDER